MNGDWCTTDGALKLKEKIEAYWRDRGYDVNIDLVEAGFIAAMRSGRTDVRSNMVNGMPTRRVHPGDEITASRVVRQRAPEAPRWAS